MIIESSSVADRIRNGQGTVGTTPQALAEDATTEPLKRGVTVKALAANADTVYVGGPETTSSSGFPLAAGESVFIAVANVSQVKVVGGLAGQEYAWVAI